MDSFRRTLDLSKVTGYPLLDLPALPERPLKDPAGERTPDDQAIVVLGPLADDDTRAALAQLQDFTARNRSLLPALAAVVALAVVVVVSVRIQGFVGSACLPVAVASAISWVAAPVATRAVVRRLKGQRPADVDAFRAARDHLVFVEEEDIVRVQQLTAGLPDKLRAEHLRAVLRARRAQMVAQARLRLAAQPLDHYPQDQDTTDMRALRQMLPQLQQAAMDTRRALSAAIANAQRSADDARRFTDEQAATRSVAQLAPSGGGL